MLKTYRITPAYIGNYRIEAFESGKNTLDIIVNDYNLQGRKQCLKLLVINLRKLSIDI